jgi:hypothetical protein
MLNLRELLKKIYFTLVHVHQGNITWRCPYILDTSVKLSE